MKFLKVEHYSWKDVKADALINLEQIVSITSQEYYWDNRLYNGYESLLVDSNATIVMTRNGYFWLTEASGKLLRKALAPYLVKSLRKKISKK